MAAAIAAGSSATARGGSSPNPVSPSAPSLVVTIALPVAIASRTFIRMPPPLRTGARTTAARSR